MKKTLLFAAALICAASFTSCSGTVPCGTYNGNQLYRGPKDGCYYKNSNGNKTYVDRSLCKC